MQDSTDDTAMTYQGHKREAAEIADEIAWSMSLDRRELTPSARARLTQYIENQRAASSPD